MSAHPSFRVLQFHQDSPFCPRIESTPRRYAARLVMIEWSGCTSPGPPTSYLDVCWSSSSLEESMRMHVISITTKVARPMTIPQYAHDIGHPARAMRRESFVRLRILISAVESHQTSERRPAFLVHADDTEPSLRERGTVRGEGPSGEERTPGRSRPLELCSTENHEHHLQNEAVMKSYYQLTL